eukprot:scaffold19639_cov65-Phaeocystis_antarctica.AAC.3
MESRRDGAPNAARWRREDADASLGTVALRGEGGNPVRQAPPQLVKSLVQRHAGLGAAVGSWAASSSLRSADRPCPVASSPPSRRVTRTPCWMCHGAPTKPRSSRVTSALRRGTIPMSTSRRAPPCASARSPRPTTCRETPRGASPSTPTRAASIPAVAGPAGLAGLAAVRGLARDPPTAVGGRDVPERVVGPGHGGHRHLHRADGAAARGECRHLGRRAAGVAVRLGPPLLTGGDHRAHHAALSPGASMLVFRLLGRFLLYALGRFLLYTQRSLPAAAAAVAAILEDVGRRHPLPRARGGSEKHGDAGKETIGVR